MGGVDAQQIGEDRLGQPVLNVDQRCRGQQAVGNQQQRHQARIEIGRTRASWGTVSVDDPAQTELVHEGHQDGQGAEGANELMVEGRLQASGLAGRCRWRVWQPPGTNGTRTTRHGENLRGGLPTPATFLVPVLGTEFTPHLSACEIQT